MKTTVIYWEKSAVVDCGCGHRIEFRIEDLVKRPPPGPGDIVVCAHCRQEYEITMEELR